MAHETGSAPPPAPASGSRVVLFADIAGSTKLYEVLGDAQAKRIVDETLIALTALTRRHGGRVVKTIGDEVMCLFDTPERGVNAAIDMQAKVDSLPLVGGAKRRIRIGFHAGAVIEEGGDVFGDTVNIAARMSAIAKGMQIMTTKSTVDALPRHLRGMTRDIAAVSVRGKADELSVCEVLWQDENDMTMTVAAVSIRDVNPDLAHHLVLRHGQTELVVDVRRPSVALGRDPGSDLVVTDVKASRHHARIEKRRDKFFLADQSTNGTFVRFTGEAEVALRREEIMLRGAGRILFGHSEIEGTPDVVEFSVKN